MISSAPSDDERQTFTLSTVTLINNSTKWINIQFNYERITTHQQANNHQITKFTCFLWHCKCWLWFLFQMIFEEIPFATLHTSIATWTTEDHPTKNFTEFVRSCRGLWCPTSTQLVQHPMLGRLDVPQRFGHVETQTWSRCQCCLMGKKKPILHFWHDVYGKVAGDFYSTKTLSCLLHVASLRQCRFSQSTLTNLMLPRCIHALQVLNDTASLSWWYQLQIALVTTKTGAFHVYPKGSTCDQAFSEWP